MVFDIVLLILLLLAALNGWRSGAMSMVLSIVVLAAALVAGSVFGSRIGELLHIGPDWIRPVIGFLFTFLVIMILGSFVKRMLRPAAGLLRGLDGLAGAALGFLRGLVVLSLFLGIFKLIHFPPSSWTEHSRLYPKFVHISGWVTGEITQLAHGSAPI
ncbi:MAG: CvpA family protein [Bacteroidota bacterium]|nr:CvpA family protein [Bacteroidota bacterium]MDP4232733.1 CvpA family protein [Bacteroidota bacterium]MDP4244049.1 CvpA family protein [Bacteroidota bacterium]MDP4287591.1 CvpA family protein [Bacteroidota bacterium]